MNMKVTYGEFVKRKGDIEKFLKELFDKFPNLTLYFPKQLNYDERHLIYTHCKGYIFEKLLKIMETPRKVLEDVEKEIRELRTKIEQLEKNGKTQLPDIFEDQFDKLLDYLYFRLKQLIKFRENDNTDN